MYFALFLMNMSKESKLLTSEAMISILAYGSWWLYHFELHRTVSIPDFYIQVEIDEHEYIHMLSQISTP